MYQICVSGASKGRSVKEGKLIAESLGKVLAESGHSLMTGATIGLPHYAAQSYKKHGGGMSLGISPAASRVEHVVKYRLPTKSYDAILYSGLHYVGRDSLLITSSDAVVSIGGRIGTLHEFTIALETNTPIGFIEGAGGIGTEIMDIMHAAGRTVGKDVIFGTDASKVLEQLVDILDERNKKYAGIYSSAK